MKPHVRKGGDSEDECRALWPPSIGKSLVRIPSQHDLLVAFVTGLTVESDPDAFRNKLRLRLSHVRRELEEFMAMPRKDMAVPKLRWVRIGDGQREFTDGLDKVTVDSILECSVASGLKFGTPRDLVGDSLWRGKLRAILRDTLEDVLMDGTDFKFGDLWVGVKAMDDPIEKNRIGLGRLPSGR
jgi:hypothetical protein